MGDKTAEITADKDGKVLWISNQSITQIIREAGVPKEKGAGIKLKVKLGEPVKKGQTLL